MNVVLVADWLYGGGAEKVVEALHHLYPDAPVYTSFCSDEWRKRLGGKVVTGYLQHWPFSSLRRFLPMLRQRWFSRLDLSAYDVIISCTGNGEAKFVQTKTSQTHICYCFTPTHFYWARYDEYLKNPSMKLKWLARFGLRLLVRPLRKRDFAAAQKVDHFVGISTKIVEDIERYYKRSAELIFPPVAVDKFAKLVSHTTASGPVITWGRLVPIKHLDIAIQACNESAIPLTIMGSGPDEERLKSLAGSTTTFTGYVSDHDRQSYIRAARAFVFCADEDFGIAPVEALAAGIPVVAYRSGGALDYVRDGVNGVFFDTLTSDSLNEALARCLGIDFGPQAVSKTAQPFSYSIFNKKIRHFVEVKTTTPAS